MAVQEKKGTKGKAKQQLSKGYNNDDTYSTFQVAFMKGPQGTNNVIYNSTTTVPGM